MLLAGVVAASPAGCSGSPAAPPSAAPSALVSTTAASAPAPSAGPSSSAPPLISPGAEHPTPRVPPVSAKAHAAGLVDIRSVVADAVVDLRYATPHNFVGVRLYPRDARCLVHESMAAGLATAAARLRREGYLLVLWDCYRPHPVQVRMFEIVPNPAWVARPGPYATSHEAGRSVDVTLARTTGTCPAGQRVQTRCLLDMGTGFDDFSPRAYAYATDGITVREQANRTLLRAAMNAGGIVGYAGEWWHFDGPGSKIARPHLDVLLG